MIIFVKSDQNTHQNAPNIALFKNKFSGEGHAPEPPPP